MALALIVCGAILLIPALVILLQAGVSALITSHTVAEPYGSLIVGGGAFLIGIILALIGMAQDRVFLVGAGVTFYSLLAIFPAIAAIVAL